MPDGFRIGSAFLDVVPDTSQLSDRLKAAVERDRTTIPLPIDIKDDDLREKVKVAAEEASVGNDVKLKVKIDNNGLENDAKLAGDRAAVGLASGMAKRLAESNNNGSGGLLSSIGSGLTGLGGGVPLLGPVLGSNPWVAGLGLGALVSSAPFLGQIIGAGLIGGLGTGLAGIGVLGALDLTKNKKGQDVIGVASIRNSFDQLKKDAKSDLQEIGTSFQPVMLSLFNTADSTINKLTPVFASADKIIAGPLKTFGDTFLQAFNQPDVKQSIDAVANAFGAIVKAVTPQLPNDFRMIANAITSIANNIAENPQAFSGFVTFLVNAAVYALNVVNALTKTANYVEQNFVPAMLSLGNVFLTIGQEIINGTKAIVDVVMSMFGTILHGAVDAFGWIPGIGSGLHDASAAFDNFKASVDNTFLHANATIDGWKKNLTTLNTTVALKGDISDLEHKLSTARNLLTDPTLTRTRRAQVEADISNLEKQIANAKAQLASIQNKTVYVNTVLTSSAPAQIKNSVIGHAEGGVIPGYAPGIDSIHAILSPGEGVLVPEAVKAMGADTIHAINAYFVAQRHGFTAPAPGAYATGGVITQAQAVNGVNSVFTRLTKAEDKLVAQLTRMIDTGHISGPTIKADTAAIVAELHRYFKGTTAKALETRLTEQAAAVTKAINADQAQLNNVKMTIANFKQTESSVTSNLANWSNLSGLNAAPTTGSGYGYGKNVSAGLQFKLNELRSFADSIEKAKKMGLSKVFIEQAIALGPDGGTQYLNAATSGGKSLIKQINDEESAIGKAEKNIGAQAASIQYGTTLSALTAQEARLNKMMEKAGQTFVKEVEKDFKLADKKLKHEITINVHGGKLTKSELHEVEHELATILAGYNI